MVANEKMLWKKLQVSQSKVELLILQIANGWEILAIENKTKAMLYDEFIKQFIIKMGVLLEEVKIEFKR